MGPSKNGKDPRTHQCLIISSPKTLHLTHTDHNMRTEVLTVWLCSPHNALGLKNRPISCHRFPRNACLESNRYYSPHGLYIIYSLLDFTSFTVCTLQTCKGPRNHQCLHFTSRRTLHPTHINHNVSTKIINF